MRSSLLQCSYVSFGSETSQTALAAGREKYHRAKGQVCAHQRTCRVSRLLGRQRRNSDGTPDASRPPAG
jgi:hypothetical protein